METPQELQVVIVYKRPQDTTQTSLEDVSHAVAEAFWKILPSQVSETYNETEPSPETIQEIEQWTKWGNTRIRKIFKHAKEKDFNKAIADLDIGKISEKRNNTRKGFHFVKTWEDEREDVELIILVPDTKENMPKVIHKMQLSGFPELNHRTDDTKEHPMVHIIANTETQMSSPKGLAAIGHAAQVMLKRLNIESESKLHKDVQTWINNGMPVKISWESYLSSESYKKLTRKEKRDIVVIHDAGFTEVEPGSITSMAMFIR